jgi:YidC/Oxa1 family membrane protein insertase
MSEIWQGLLNAIGAVLAAIYDVIPNYGVAIIILTLLFRLLLLPLGIKQIKSMQAMQAIQPRIKEIQKKYKGNKEKIQSETMKVYQEAGVNPLGGCLPVLLQFPFLIAMYGVIRAPAYQPSQLESDQPAYAILNNHLPWESLLFGDVITHENIYFLGMNLQCSASQSGSPARVVDTDGKGVVAGAALERPTGQELPYKARPLLDCGDSVVSRIPYFALLAFMVATSFYQQRQQQRSTPAGAQTAQQQMLFKIFPVMFAFFGFTFPSGLVVYWSAQNVFMVIQQDVLIRLGHVGPEAAQRTLDQRKNKAANKASKPSLFQRMAAQAEEQQRQRSKGQKKNPRQAPPSGGKRRRPPPRGPSDGNGSGRGK